MERPEDLNKFSRPVEVPDTGLLCDTLWSDPDTDITGWAENDRGVSFTFGADVVSKFLDRNDLDLIVRAHQVVEDGYEFFGERTLVTVFSAPNYCGEFDNCGAMMSVDENLQCSFQVLKPIDSTGQRWNSSRPGTPARARARLTAHQGRSAHRHIYRTVTQPAPVAPPPSQRRHHRACLPAGAYDGFGHLPLDAAPPQPAVPAPPPSAHCGLPSALQEYMQW